MSDEEFQGIAFRFMAEDMDNVIDQVVDLEAQARYAGIVEDNPDESARLANLAHSVFSDVTLKTLPTLVMGLADRVNVERELVMECLEVLHKSSALLRLYAADVAARFPGDPTSGRAQEILADLDGFLDAHPYQRVTE